MPSPYNPHHISPASMPQPIIHAFPSRISSTEVYLVVDPITEDAAIINPILDLDPLTNEIRTRSADRLLKFINDEGITVRWILETALHRDRISACRYLQLTLRHIGDGIVPQVCVGENSFCTCEDDGDADDTALHSSPPPSTMQRTTLKSAPKSPDAFDHLFTDGEQLRIGNMAAHCEHSDEGHGVTYGIGPDLFTSDGFVRVGGTRIEAGVVTHPEPPPEKQAGRPSPPSIDSVLGSPTQQDNSNGAAMTEAESMKGGQQAASPMLAFYAEQINTRGGRIPKKINMPPSLALSSSVGLRKASLGSQSSQGSGKGKERERKPVPGAGGAQQQMGMMPLRIPRKLGVIMC